MNLFRQTRAAGFLAALLASAAVFAAGCGYKLVKEDSVSLPSGVTGLSVPLAKNMTIEAALEDLFTQQLIATLEADGRIPLLPAGKADTELRCTLKDLDTRAVSYTEEGRVAAEEISLTCTCRLAIVQTGAVVWETGELSDAEEYPVGLDYLANENARKAALLEISRNLAENVRSMLLDSF